MKRDMDEAFEVFDLRPRAAPAGISLERLVTPSHLSDSTNQATLPTVDKHLSGPVVDSDTAFNRWLQQEQARLAANARRIGKH